MITLTFLLYNLVQLVDQNPVIFGVYDRPEICEEQRQLLLDRMQKSFRLRDAQYPRPEIIWCQWTDHQVPSQMPRP